MPAGMRFKTLRKISFIFSFPDTLTYSSNQIIERNRKYRATNSPMISNAFIAI